MVTSYNNEKQSEKIIINYQIRSKCLILTKIMNNVNTQKLHQNVTHFDKEYEYRSFIRKTFAEFCCL